MGFINPQWGIDGRNSYFTLHGSFHWHVVGGGVGKEVLEGNTSCMAEILGSISKKNFYVANNKENNNFKCSYQFGMVYGLVNTRCLPS